MLLALDRLDSVYKQIKTDASTAAGACTVVIFVAPDCDAICACRILTGMLRTDALSYQIRPVRGYTDIRVADANVLADNTELRSVVLINCGAIVNITSLLKHLPPAARCYVADSHRPVHLANIHARRRVVVLGGEEEAEWEGVPSDGDDLSCGVDSSEDKSDTDSVSDEEEFGDGDDDGAGGGSDGDDNGAGGGSDGEEDAEERFGEDGASTARDKAGKDGDGGSDGGSDTDGDSGGSGDARAGNRRKRRRDEKRRRRGGRDPADDDGSSSDSGSSSGSSSSDGGSRSEANSDAKERGTDGANALPGRKRSSGGRKRWRGHAATAAVADARADRRRRLQLYYGGGSYHGAASAVLMYEMASSLGMNTNDMLWMAIVGQTDLLVHGRVDDAAYNFFVQHYNNAVLTLNADTPPRARADDGSGFVPAAEAGRIVFSHEYRLMMHRHWSLYESMFYSNYVASRLGVWRTNGEARLRNLLAEVGLSLVDARQKFSFLRPREQRHLREQLELRGPAQGLPDLLYGSFVRNCGFESPVSAADIVYSVTALMEHTVRRGGPGSGGGGSSRDAGGGRAGGAGGEGEGQEEGEDDSWLDSFNEAYDALAGRRAEPLRRGLELSMALQKAMVQQAVSMVDKGALTPLKYFRYAYLHATEADERLFTQPVALAKLAAFLLEMHRENGKWVGAKAKPLVVLAERADQRSYLVVGATGAERAGDVLKNRFGARFALAAAAANANANVRRDGFEASVIEVDRDHVQRFVEALHDNFSVR